MKHKIILATLFVALFAGCKNDEPEVLPKAKFSYVADEFKVSFKNESTNSKRYEWNFGNGEKSVETNPTITYKQAGTYTVSLKAWAGTKSDSYSEEITVSLKDPQANFSFTTNGLEVTFSNQSTNAQSYSWNFGNGKTSTEKDPKISYNAAGTYAVKLTAFNGEKSNTVSKNVTVSYKQPTASFTYKTAHPLKVVLTNTSSNAVSYEWDFGDGTTSTEKSPTHKYSGIGVYKIKLTAKSGNKISTSEKNVTIEAPTTCYITGFTIQKIPTNNVYYQVQLTDDYVMSKTTYFYTDWYLLSSANIPFHHDLNNKKQLDINETYVVRLYKSSSKTTGQASGKGDYSASITSTQLKKYPETVTWSTTNVGMELFFLWQ